MDETKIIRDNETGIKAILKGIYYNIAKMLKSAPYDKTYIGVVSGVNVVNNTYSVQIDGHTYTDVMSTIRTYNGHIVIVMCPQNQLSQMFIYGEIDTTDYT